MSVNHRKLWLESHAIEARNALIVELRQTGQLLKTIAARVNLTEPRVSQIYLAWVRAQPRELRVRPMDCRRRNHPPPNRSDRGGADPVCGVDQP